MRGVYARDDSEVLGLRTVIEFFKTPLGTLVLCLVGGLFVVRTTVRVAVQLQRR
jgi:hypothetical protein